MTNIGEPVKHIEIEEIPSVTPAVEPVPQTEPQHA